MKERKNMKISKRLVSLFLSFLILLIFIMNPLQSSMNVVSAASDKSKIKTTINAYFKAAKAFDINKMAKYTLGSEESDIISPDTLPSLRKYLKTRNKSLNYTIKKIKINQNNATVTVKCKYLDSTSTFERAVDNLILFFAKNSNKNYSDEILLKKYDNSFKKFIKKDKEAYKKKYTTKTYKFNMVKENGNWKIDSDNDNLANTATSNLYNVLTSFLSSLE